MPAPARPTVQLSRPPRFADSTLVQKIGPGAGLSAIGTVLSVIGAVLLAVASGGTGDWDAYLRAAVAAAIAFVATLVGMF